MPFYLWRAVLGSKRRTEIDQSQAENIITAWHSIAALTDIEEEWDCLVQNYFDLEMKLLQSAMHSMIVLRESYHDFHEERLAFARKLSGLLQACRSYLDHTPHHLSSLKDGNDLKDRFRASTNTAYEAYFGYRFMEALRNYAQHRGLPLHGASFNSRWTGDVRNGDKGQLEHSVAASINLSEIRSDKGFSAKVLAEVDKQERLDVATLTREYMEGLGTVHDALRQMLREPRSKWTKVIRDAINQYAAIDGKVIGLCVAEFDERDCVKEQTSIFDDLLVRLERMMARNGSLVNLRLRYVTNEITPGKKASG